MSDNADEPLEVIVRRHARQLVKSSTPMLDARLLAQSVLGLSDADFILASPNDVKLQDRQTIEKLVARRVVGEPMAYLLGEKEIENSVGSFSQGCQACQKVTVSERSLSDIIGFNFSFEDFGIRHDF